MNGSTLASAVFLGAAAWSLAAASPQSPLAVAPSPDGKTLYVAMETGHAVAAVDVASGRVARTTPLDGAPSGMAVSPDGATVAVTIGPGAGRIVLVNAADGAARTTLSCGHSPCAPVFAPDGKTLYVCDRFNNAVAVIDVATGRETARIAVEREPVAAAITPDGSALFVANHLPAGAATNDLVAACISVIDTAQRTRTDLRLPNGSTALRGITVSPDGRNAYAVHTLARYPLPTTQLERGWMNTSALTVLDATNRAYVATVLLDDVDLGAANPWGVVCTPDGATLAVAHSGTHEISLIDRAKLHDRIARAFRGERVTEVTSSPATLPDDLSFLYDIRRRIGLSGQGPRGLAVAGGKLFAAVYFADALAALDPASDPVRPVSIPLGPPVEEDIVRRGERLFHNALSCFQHWQSCTSCHPDIRADALNWDLLNDGIGNPKQTKSMLLSHATPPSMASGVRDSAETAVRAGFRYIQFHVPDDAETAAVDEFLKSLQAVPSPHLVNGKPAPAAVRGEKVFQAAGCAECHPAPLFSDLKLHELGYGSGQDTGKPCDTPTLVECWRTAPYLHDGRAATLRDVLTTYNLGDRHGKTQGLTDQDLADLEAYIGSL